MTELAFKIGILHRTNWDFKLLQLGLNRHRPTCLASFRCVHGVWRQSRPRMQAPTNPIRSAPQETTQGHPLPDSLVVCFPP